MEISASAQTASARPASRPEEINGRLAALRALQRTLERPKAPADPEQEAKPQPDGKGRLLDIRC